MLTPMLAPEGEPVTYPDIPIEEDAIEVEIAGSSATDFSTEDLSILGAWVSREFEAAEAIRDTKLAEWEESRKHYANEPIAFVSTIIDDAKDIPINHASTKADALRDLVVGNLFSVKPWFIPVIYGVEASEMWKLDALVQRILEKTQLEERCKESSEDSWCTNHAIFRVYFDPDINTYTIDNIDPECFVVGGGDKFGIENSVLVGHSYQERKADIDYSIEEDEYYAYPSQPEITDKKVDTNPMDTVKLAQLFVKFDEDKLKKSGKVCPVKQWYLMTIDVDAKHILKIERFTLSDRPWYFSASYLPCKKTGGFWSKHSLGAFMQGPHIASNILVNTSIYGGVTRAFPPVVADGEMTDQTDKLAWGKVKTTYGGNVTAPFQQFDPSTLEMVSARVERIGDGVARISQAGSGMTFNKGMTATEAQIIAESQGQGVSGYVSTFALTLEELVLYIYDTLKFTAGKILEDMDPVLQPVDMDLFSKDVVWVASGRGQFASPGLRMAQLDKVDEMSRDPRLVGKFNAAEIAESKLSLMGLTNKERLFDRNAQPPAPPQGPPGGPLGGIAEGGINDEPIDSGGPSLFA